MILYTAVSSNAKTGPIPVSGSLGNTCPSVCPFKKQGCYAKYGPIAWHWAKLNKGKVGIEWGEYLANIRKLPQGQLHRYAQFGDLPGIGNRIDTKKLGELADANKGRRGFAYTHKPVLDSQSPLADANRKAIKAANDKGMTVNLSGNNPAHADELKALGIAPVVTTVAENTPNVSYTPKGNKIIICPAQQKEGITCAHCKLCSVANRSVIIGFKPHGMGAKYVEKVAA